MKTSKRNNNSAPTTSSIMISINKRIPKKEPKLDLKPSMSTPTSTAMLIKQKKKKIGIHGFLFLLDKFLNSHFRKYKQKQIFFRFFKYWHTTNIIKESVFTNPTFF